MISNLPGPTYHWLRLTALFLVAIGGTGCATLPRPIKAVLTPLTVVRDVVDVPLVSVANGFEYFADHTRIAKAPGAGVGWSWTGGFNWGIGYDMSHFPLERVLMALRRCRLPHLPFPLPQLAEWDKPLASTRRPLGESLLAQYAGVMVRTTAGAPTDKSFLVSCSAH